MAKDKSEKKDRKEKKEKRSESDGVKKSKKDKKSKLSGDNIAAVVEELEKEEPTEVVLKAKVDGDIVKPVGALVPFANPLADEKVTKKVLKSVKKGSRPDLSRLEDKTNYFTIQRPRTKPSSAESKKWLRPCGNPLRVRATPRRPASSSWRLISRPWMSFRISPSCVKTIMSHTSMSPAEQSLELQETPRDLPVWSWYPRPEQEQRRPRRSRAKRSLAMSIRTW